MERLVLGTKNLFTTSKLSKQLTRKSKRNKPLPSGLASPAEDGWFLSDFFMFYHLFKGLGMFTCRFFIRNSTNSFLLIYTIGASQRWLLSETPRHLLSKYSNYEHGECSGEHRLVLGPELIDSIGADSNIRVFDVADLLQDFLRTFQDECKIAAQLSQPILLIIFGHGDPVTYGIAIGGRESPINAPRLHTNHIVASLRGLDVALTMLLTSCYSGGWVLQPNLNISALTAAGAKKPSTL